MEQTIAYRVQDCILCRWCPPTAKQTISNLRIWRSGTVLHRHRTIHVFL